MEDHITGIPTSGVAKLIAVKRDFFGRIVDEPRPCSRDGTESVRLTKAHDKEEGRGPWISFHEGFSNAVRKPITLDELIRGF